MANLDRIGAEPRGPRMYMINIVSAALAILVAALFLLSSRQIDRAYENENRVTEKYVTSEMAATTLKQGPYNLTTQVRLYTITRTPTTSAPISRRWRPQTVSERSKR